LAVIEHVCAERGSPLTLVGRNWTWRLPAVPSAQEGTKDPTAARDSQSFELRSAQGPSDLDGTYTLPLLGLHQLNNALVAIAGVDLLRGAGLALNATHLRHGLASVRWPGRFEILRKDPPLVVDCAHNDDSVTKLVATLREWFPGRRWTVILGASRDKDVPGMLRALAPVTEGLVATQSRHSRAMPARRLADLAAEILPPAGVPLENLEVTGDVGEAMHLAFRVGAQWQGTLSAPTGEKGCQLAEPMGPICVTGSIFVVADFREAWALHTGGKLPETDPPFAG
jgi:dihydrofolate synthase/folylpolyglutamate synthase